ncbi:MAG TPA: hypothetical protein VLC51_01215, partial [Nitrospira sp.]|nr:hypothetical protein [Nitrospira sp.]
MKWKSPRCGRACWDEIKSFESDRARLLQQIIDIGRDRDEWKRQHENLLAIYQAELQRKSGRADEWHRELIDREPD